MSEAVSDSRRYLQGGSVESSRPVVLMRVLGFPERDEIHAFMDRTGAELAGAYTIFSGVNNPESSFGRSDGMEFVFHILPTELGNPTSREQNVTEMLAGVDRTEYYREGYEAEGTSEPVLEISP